MAFSSAGSPARLQPLSPPDLQQGLLPCNAAQNTFGVGSGPPVLSRPCTQTGPSGTGFSSQPLRLMRKINTLSNGKDRPKPKPWKKHRAWGTSGSLYPNMMELDQPVGFRAFTPGKSGSSHASFICPIPRHREWESSNCYHIQTAH